MSSQSDIANYSDDEHKDFLNYRNLLIRLETEQRRSLDNHLLTIASSALGLSLLLLNSILRPVIWKDILLASWVSLIFCIGCILLSFHFGEKDCRRRIEKLDKRFKQQETGENTSSDDGVTKITKSLNRASAWLFFIGVLMLLMFAAINVIYKNA
jgi:anaerobic C4-dicarboxylate transporter